MLGSSWKPMNLTSLILTHRNKRQKKSKIDIASLILSYSESNNNLLAKYSIDFFVDYFDALKLHYLEKVFGHLTQISIEQFCCVLLISMEHDKSETIFLLMGLSNLYSRIKETISSNQQHIKYTDFTNFLCEKISDTDPDLIIPLRDTDQQSKLGKLKDNPCIFNHSKEFLPQISIDDLKKSKGLQSSTSITHLVYSQILQKILTLGRLEPCIQIYDIELNFITKIKPRQSIILKKNFPILSFDFSDQIKCLGCIVKGVGLVFWDDFDHFETQKTIKKVEGWKILYIKSIKRWITLQENFINVWNLKEEKIIMKIHLQYSRHILSLCEVDHLKLIVIALTLLDDTKWLYLLKIQEKSWKIISKLQIFNFTCHHIYYNKYTEAILILGYRNTVPVYLIDNKSQDLHPIEELRGHRSIVTCVTSLGNSIIVTGDDNGYVRVWDLKYIRCLQVLRLSKQIFNLKCLAGNYLLFSDKRLNSIPIQRNKMIEYRSKELKIVNSVIDDDLSYLYIFTKSSCHVINLSNGFLEEIHILCSDQDITVAKKHKNFFYFGTSKGNLIKYDFDFKKRGQYHIHEADISQLTTTEDDMFITTSNDTTMKIWIKSCYFETASKTLTHLYAEEELTILRLSEKYRALILSYGNETLYFCDYQSLKISHSIEFPSNVVNVHFIYNYPIFIVTCENGQIYCYLFTRKQAYLQIDAKQSIEIEGIELEAGEYWQQFTVFHDFKLIIGSSRGRVAKLQLSKLFQTQVFNFVKIAKIEKDCPEQSANAHRPIRQSFKDRVRQSVYENQKFEQNRKIVLDCLNFQKISDKPILQIIIYEENKILAIREEKQFKILDLLTFECLCEMVIDEKTPKKWQKLQKNKQKLVKSFFSAIDLMTKIQEIEISSFKQFEKFQLSRYQEVYKFAKELLDIYQFRETPKNQQNQEYNEKQNSKDHPPKRQASIKALEVYKRVKKVKEQKQYEGKRLTQIEENFSSKLLKENNEELKNITSFFRPNFRSKFRAISTPISESNNLLYNRIKSKLEKKTEGKSVSFGGKKIKKIISLENFKKDIRKSIFIKDQRSIVVQQKKVVVTEEKKTKNLMNRFYRLKNEKNEYLKDMLIKQPKKFRQFCREIDTKLKKAKKNDKL